MHVHQFRYNSDNLAYLVESGGEALVIDGGATDGIMRVIAERGLHLVGITHTHDHPDHVQGSRILCEQSGASLIHHLDLLADGGCALGGGRVLVLPTPGHTMDSVCFRAGNALISGDTLFNGTVGNCFSGDLDAFFESMERLMSLPPETRVYAGHDYLREAVAFARSIEPDNPFLEAFLAAWNPEHVLSTLADEMRVNPYLRYGDPVMKGLLQKRGLPVDTPLRCWYSLMEVY
ncbi:MBL fold metallo-hydrolase [Desulfobotulus sp. H1]|uniref:hydroxyacylglutathione hydrolase n=1 Tax=Desulfobotulus pelophilus TaxID=2823377 RepID=A0ABT3N546_9BACT|nr:MBL fold metallo-hydrolase [Desulfobotulus pelophilus]MCW7752564.1 MBL fold metallo-hydrolase [Desulfobotulus pelophilus]